jgi:hypothetical protein
VNTPEVITDLKPNEVFVFGSNSMGLHGAGAAKLAHDRFGAVWGVGEGLRGQSYALPTMEGIESFRAAVGRFLSFAIDHQDIRFLVTKVGTGIAGYSVGEVAPMFSGAPANVVLPLEFEEWTRLAGLGLERVSSGSELSAEVDGTRGTMPIRAVDRG